MNGHVFRCSTEGSDRKEFAKTLENAVLYTNVHISEAQDIVGIFTNKDFTMPTVAKPQKKVLSEEEQKEADKVAFVDALYKEQIRRYATHLDKQAANQRALYSVMWGQCSPTLQSKIQGVPNYQTMHSTCDLTMLLKEIRNVSYALDSSKNGYLVSFTAISKVSEDTTCAMYLKNYEALLSVLDHLGIELGSEPTLIENAAKELGFGSVSTLSTDERNQCKTTAMERFQAILFLYRSDQKRYGSLIRDLENLQAWGEDQYPKTISETYNMIAQYKAPPRSGNRRQGDNPAGGPTGVSFLQAGARAPGADQDDPVPDNRNRTFADIRCYHCGRLGHYSVNCPFRFPRDLDAAVPAQDINLLIDEHPDPDPLPDPNADPLPPPPPAYDHDVNDDINPVHMLFHQSTDGGDTIPDTWILLDSQSTVNIFKNPIFLTDIHESSSGELRVLTNGGICVSHLVGTLPNFGTVWYNPSSLANILSLRAVRQVCRVTMDTDKEVTILVHLKDGTIMRFIKFCSGLYFFNASKAISRSSSPSSGYCFIDTVPNNLASFTRREIEGATAARVLYRKLGRPSQSIFEHLLASNFIRNCPITADDARRATYIYGPDLASLKGKTTRRSPTHVPHIDLVLCHLTFLNTIATSS